MTITGTLRIENANSRLDGVLLAYQNQPDPFSAATTYLLNHGVGDNDRITVTGQAGFVGNVPVFFIEGANKLFSLPGDDPTRPKG